MLRYPEIFVELCLYGGVASTPRYSLLCCCLVSFASGVLFGLCLCLFFSFPLNDIVKDEDCSEEEKAELQIAKKHWDEICSLLK